MRTKTSMTMTALVAAAVALGLVTDARARPEPGPTSAARSPETSGRHRQPEPLRLVDPLMPLSELRPRTVYDLDRLEAETRYAHGRFLFQRGAHADALRQYQRAWRLDPAASPVLAEIVALATQMNRMAVAARYAELAHDGDSWDPELLRQLALYLTDRNEYAQAARLYKWLLATLKGEKPDPNVVFLHFELGRLYFLTEQYGKSADSYEIVRAALEKPRDFGLRASMRKFLLGDASVTYTLMGESFLRAGRPLSAADLFQTANPTQTNRPLLAFYMARVAEAQGKTEQGLRQLDEYFQAKLSDAGTEPYELLARLLQKDAPGDAGQEALRKRLEELHQMDPANAPLAYFLAQVYLEAEQVDKAKPLYIELAKTAPTIQALTALIDISRRERDLDTLIRVLGDAVEALGTLTPLGEAASALSEDAELVNPLLSAAQARMAHKEPTLTGDMAVGVALTLMGHGKFEDAGRLFEFAIDTNGSRAAELLSKWGMELFLAEQYDRAASVLQRALQSGARPEAKALLNFYLSGAFEMAGKTEQAIAAAEAAAKLNDQSALLQGRRAWVLYHAKRNDEAEGAYRKLLDRFDAEYGSIEVREVLRDVRSALSNLCLMRKAQDEAEEWLEQILDEFPDDVGAMNDLGYLWADENKNLHRALDMVTRAVEREPENIAYRDSLGWALYRLGRYEEAVEQLGKAAAGDDPDGVILDHLGDAYRKAGKVTAAVSAWRRAIQALESADEGVRISAIQTKIEQHSSE